MSLSEISPAFDPGAGTYAAVISRAVFRTLSRKVMIRVTGDDRVSFLHGMCSNDVRELATDGMIPALFLTERAHLIAESFMWNTDDGILIELERSAWPRVRDHLERLLVADDVELEEATELELLDIEGPQANAIAAELVGSAVPPFRPWHHAFDARVWIGNLPRLGIPAYTIFGPRAEIARITEALSQSEVPLAAEDLFETIRIENGVARPDVDTNDRTIALEARMERSISFSKGCYLGQETIERATARGGLKKRLFGLRIGGGEIPPAGSVIKLDGKEVGHLTSVAVSPRFGVIGLAILHHSAWGDGCGVIVEGREGELGATVSELPFK
ncbi:MAG: YgfZ/GcvT domain-containing protein [Candidatus Binataceae bacterium]